MAKGLVGRCVLALPLLAATLACSSARAATPEQLFSADASGMVRIDARCPGSTQQGSGFLLGPRLLMTARHVLVDREARPCSGTAVQAGSGKSVRIVRWMAIRAVAGRAPTDLALAVLASPLAGHDFALSASSPQPGQLLIALGYALGQPLSLNQGHVAALSTRNGVRLIEMELLEAGGASGGPILDANGEVVGLTQFGVTGLTEAVDLAHLAGGDPAQFCFGVARGQPSTICTSQRPASARLEQDGPPPLCDGAAVDPPFEACPLFAADGTGVLAVSAQCPKYGHWAGSGVLLGPRLLMTARQDLIDPDTGQPCTTTVIQSATGRSARITRWTAFQVAADQASTDVAVAVLDRPLSGYDFTLSPTSPKAGELVHALTSVFGSPGLLNAAHVIKHFVEGVGPASAALGQFELSVQGWSSGGPIVNANNQVVGLEQWGSTGRILSIDLAGLSHGDAAAFCVGDARGEVSTICPPGATPSATLLAPDTPPQVCGGHPADPPFTQCEAPPGTQAPPPTTTTSSLPAAVAALTRCWVSSADSYDSSLQVSQVADTSPVLYFVWQFASTPPPLSSATVTLTPPDGAPQIRFSGALSVFVGGGSTFYSSLGTSYMLGPAALGTAPVADGSWTFEVSLAMGSTCSASVSADPAGG